MARPLRIERPGGRYHVTARGVERKSIYREDRDPCHFLELLGEAVGQFGVAVHAYALMDNHYHLLVETPEANLGRAMQWLNVSYSVWFNRRHNRVGHLFQGRYQAVIIEDDAGWQEVARYVHLNPVRLAALGLGKRDRSARRAGIGPRPSPELIARRLSRLREFPWSSYRAYAGYARGPVWLCRQPLDRLCGGRSEGERRAALRDYTENPLRQGVLESPWARLVAGVVLGSAEFARRLRQEMRGNPREQAALRKMQCRLPWESIVEALEEVKGESWDQFNQRHGDWGRDAALWLGRKRGRYKLSELGELAGGMDYAAVGQAVSRFGRRLDKERGLRHQVGQVESYLSNV